MSAFLQRFGAFIAGVLCGYDRIRFRGTKRQLTYPNGIVGFLRSRNVRLQDFREYAQGVTESLFQAIEPPAKEAGIYRYLGSNRTRPEDVAREIAAERGRTDGLIAVLGRVEPCQTIKFHRASNGWWTPRLVSGAKCLHYYHYYQDPLFGLRYTRLQSWFPFTQYVGLNGREWLARQMAAAGIGFIQRDNCFTHLDDLAAAQALADAQLRIDWSGQLDRWSAQSNPLADTLLGGPVPYYWTVQEAEYATDILFRSADDLTRLYPAWVHHAYAGMSSGDLLRYLSYPVRLNGVPKLRTNGGEVKSTLKDFGTGTRIRHRIHGNLLKMYDKMGSVLRVETMIQDVTHFRVSRPVDPETTAVRNRRRKKALNGCRRGHPGPPLADRLPMRKGVVDLPARAEVSRAANDRYVESLAVVADTQPLGAVAGKLGRRAVLAGRPVRALNPLSEIDAGVLTAINRGSFVINGFRNRDLREALFGSDENLEAVERSRRSMHVTRWLRMLRAHEIVTKVAGSHSYHVTAAGRTQVTALLAARAANIERLMQAT